MGTFTLENFRAELLFDLKNRSDTSSAEGFTEARQDTFINAAYLHVTHPTVFRHRELQYQFPISLLDGVPNYTFSPLAGISISSIRYVTHFYNPPALDRRKLYPHDEQWFAMRSPQSGTPRDYMVMGNLLTLSPVPGPNEAGSFLMVGAWREPDLLTAGQTTLLSSLWDEIVLLAARWRAELHLGYRDLAEATKLDFVSLINEYKDFEDLHNEDWDWVVEVRNESSMEQA